MIEKITIKPWGSQFIFSSVFFTKTRIFNILSKTVLTVLFLLSFEINLEKDFIQKNNRFFLNIKKDVK